MNRIRFFAGALVAASLTGCIMLPPPPPMYHRPPPGLRGDGGPMPFGDARRSPPPPERAAHDMCDARCAPGEPDTQPPGAR